MSETAEPPYGPLPAGVGPNKPYIHGEVPYVALGQPRAARNINAALGPPPRIDKGVEEGRRFLNAPELNAAIDRALASIPAGKSVAVLGFADTMGVGAVAAVKLGGSFAGWSLMGVLDYTWGGVLEAQASVRWMR